MTEVRADLEKKLQVLRAAYLAGLPVKLAELETLHQYLVAHPQRESIEKLRAAVHKLAGSGGTFGFSGLSETARRLEQTLNSWLADSVLPEAGALAALAPMVAQLRDQTTALPDIGPQAMPVRAMPSSTERLTVYLVEDDAELAQELSAVLSTFSYEVTICQSQAAARAALDNAIPHAIIIDLALPEGPLAGIELARAINTFRDRPPVAFISARTDFAARLAAARVGVTGYFVKPLEFAPLIDWLDHHTHKKDEEGYRIVLVDDDLELAEYHAIHLRAAGMEVTVVSDPGTILEVLPNARPDLILLDLYMPACSGPELAAVIRQQENYIGVPIVYLSNEADVDKQQMAMQVGADDFLIKPITPARLLAAVSVRAQRARRLNNLMSTDSLTGLLKHAKIKEQLVIEVERARRAGTPLAFVMLDIDHFKKVNDVHGHLMGDRVIKAFAHLLKQRLRRSDLIGRYGGEEFAIVMPDCKLDDARQTVEDIRRRFAVLRFGQAGSEFSVALSAGIAVFPAISAAESLNAAADAALYEAKSAGRNRVCLASPGGMT